MSARSKRVGAEEIRSREDRPIPFTLRVAVEWIEFKDFDDLSEGTGYFMKRARLTGSLNATSDFQDIEFSDLGCAH
ncbi:hypothetical protein [Streptomyces sp. enrichment culture]|uniref:hypothetical protein n=1 Tax=Streptomyces sp. enrichment culture TaxID=1795815 RepID=UPI003F55295B